MPLTDRFERAFSYANRLHGEQVRKGTTIPYITHLMSVAGIVADYGGDEDQMIAGLLHDVVEDQGGDPRREEIRNLFGDRVAVIVEDCTDADTVPKPPWEARKKAYIAHLAHADPASLLVSAADKLHNARAIVADLRQHGPKSLKKFTGKKVGTLWYYRKLVEVFAARGRNPLIDELERTTQTMHELAEAEST